MNEQLASLGKKVFIEEVAPILIEQMKSALQKAGAWIIGKVGDIVRSIGQDSNINTVLVKRDLLKKDDIIQIAKENIVPNSNMVAALMDSTEDCYVVYLAYLRDKELLPVEENKYVTITAEGLSRDVDALFKGQQLIVIK
jgi:hypothetical protein